MKGIGALVSGPDISAMCVPVLLRFINFSLKYLIVYYICIVSLCHMYIINSLLLTHSMLYRICVILFIVVHVTFDIFVMPNVILIISTAVFCIYSICIHVKEAHLAYLK